jgi:PAS domain-containing protein
VAHVELALSGAFVPQARTPAEAGFVAGISRWMSTVAAAPEPCLIIDVTTTIIALSPSCGELLGLGKPADAVGQPLLGGVLRLIDFTAGGGELAELEIEQIPPLLAIRSEQLARGLMRVQPRAGGQHLTVDAIATPLTQDDQVVASLTFFSAIRY